MIRGYDLLCLADSYHNPTPLLCTYHLLLFSFLAPINKGANLEGAKRVQYSKLACTPCIMENCSICSKRP